MSLQLVNLGIYGVLGCGTSCVSHWANFDLVQKYSCQEKRSILCDLGASLAVCCRRELQPHTRPPRIARYVELCRVVQGVRAPRMDPQVVRRKRTMSVVPLCVGPQRVLQAFALRRHCQDQCFCRRPQAYHLHFENVCNFSLDKFPLCTNHFVRISAASGCQCLALHFGGKLPSTTLWRSLQAFFFGGICV